MDVALSNIMYQWLHLWSLLNCGHLHPSLRYYPQDYFFSFSFFFNLQINPRVI